MGNDDVESAPTEVAATVTSTPSSGLGEGVLQSLGEADTKAFARRYSVGGAIGRGGMGEVRALEDARVGRRVAMKMLHAKSDAGLEARARFVREMRIQGQLEHPAVVPVYDVGLDPSGNPYFTMKELKGETLQQILSSLRKGDADMRARFSTRKLLDQLRNVCLAVDFAHSRGVIHRDLKPGNVMLGDFGEVYVLDWGLAKVIGEPDLARAPTQEPDSSPPSRPSLDVDDSATEAGSVMGTPGYMAPEQIYGEELDGRVDVYALGAMLFEILAGEPLHARDGDILSSTTEGVDSRPSARAPERDIAPELDDLCVEATATERQQRTSSARELADALDRYLDGDRDLERRRQLADEHAGAGIGAIEKMAEGADGSEDARRLAVRELGRALALDPDHEQASTALTRLMLEPPSEVPAEVERALAERRTRMQTHEAGGTAVAFLASLVFVPLFMWMGITDPLLIAAIVGVPLIVAALQAYMAVKGPVAWMRVSEGILFAVFVGISGQVFSPFLVVPVVCTLVVTIVAIYGYSRLLVLTGVVMTLGATIPVLGQVAGVFPATFQFASGQIQIWSPALDFPFLPTLLSLMLFQLLTLWAPALIVGRMSERSIDYERQIEMHAWHLRQLVPSERAN